MVDSYCKLIISEEKISEWKDNSKQYRFQEKQEKISENNN